MFPLHRASPPEPKRHQTTGFGVGRKPCSRALTPKARGSSLLVQEYGAGLVGDDSRGWLSLRRSADLPACKHPKKTRPRAPFFLSNIAHGLSGDRAGTRFSGALRVGNGRIVEIGALSPALGERIADARGLS